MTDRITAKQLGKWKALTCNDEQCDSHRTQRLLIAEVERLLRIEAACLRAIDDLSSDLVDQERIALDAAYARKVGSGEHDELLALLILNVRHTLRNALHEPEGA